MSETITKQIEQKYTTRKKYLRASEVKSYLGIGLSTVWLYAKEGKLTPKKISARVTVFSIEEIDNLINTIEVA